MNRAARTTLPATSRSVFGDAAAPKAPASFGVAPAANRPGDGERAGATLGLDYMLGFTGRHRHTLLFHPNQTDTIIYGLGRLVVVSSLIDDGPAQRFLRGHDADVSALVVSRSGRLLVSGSTDSVVIVWNCDSGIVLGRFVAPSGTGSVRCLALSDDERWLGCVSEPTSLSIWELGSGELVSCEQRYDISAMVFGVASNEVSKSRRNPSYSLYTCIDSTALIHQFDYDIKTMQYDMTTRRCDAPGRGALRRTFTCCDLDRSRQILLCGSTAGDVAVFDVRVGLFKANFPACSGGIHSLTVFGGTLCVGGGDGTMSMYVGSESSWNRTGRTELHGALTSLSSSADQREVIVGTSSGRIYRVRASDALDSLLVRQSPTTTVVDIAFSPRHCSIMASIDLQGQLDLWDLTDNTILAQLHGPGRGTVVAFETGSDDRVLSGWADGGIRCYTMGATTSSATWEIAHAVRGEVTGIAQHDASTVLVVSGSSSGSVRIWDRNSRILLAEYLAHAVAPVTSIALDVHDPSVIHSCGADRRHVSYDFARQVYLSGHQERNGHFASMGQRSTGEYETVTALTDGRIIVWDIDVADPVFVYKSLGNQSIRCLDVSPSGRYVVSVEESDMICVYEFLQGACGFRQTSTMRVHCGPICRVRWMPDEKGVVCVGDDCCICLCSFEAPR